MMSKRRYPLLRITSSHPKISAMGMAVESGLDATASGSSWILVRSQSHNCVAENRRRPLPNQDCDRWRFAALYTLQNFKEMCGTYGLDRKPSDLREDILPQYRLHLGEVVACPAVPLLLNPFSGDRLESIRSRSGSNQPRCAPMSRRVDSLFDQLTGLVALCPRLLQRDRGILPPRRTGSPDPRCDSDIASTWCRSAGLPRTSHFHRRACRPFRPALRSEFGHPWGVQMDGRP